LFTKFTGIAELVNSRLAVMSLVNKLPVTYTCVSPIY